jgi:acyl-CoA synthetase
MEAGMSARRLHSAQRVADYTGRGWWTGETVQQLFADRLAERGDAEALVDPPNKTELVDLSALRLSWTEVGEAVDHLAAVLLANGIGEGDVLGIQLPNIAELAIAYLAAWRVRAIVSPLPVQYRRHEIESMSSRARFRALLTADRILDRPAAREALELVPSVLYYGPSDVTGAIRVSEVDGDPSGYADAHPVDPNDCLTICWTSGTESAPKGVPRAHYEWLAISADTVRAPGLSGESRILNPFPMVNMAAISGMLLPWLRTGCVLVQHHPFDLPTFLTQVASEQVTYTVAPPALLAMLLHRSELLTGISSLQAIGSGSAPLQEWVVRGWHEQHGITIINYFGSNEGIALMTDVEVMTDPAQRAAFFPRYGSGVRWSFETAGRTDVRLVDPETGAEITEPGVPGELRLRGPSVFAGYLDGTKPFDPDGYLVTGDVFVIDGPNEEFLRFVDRTSDLIIRGGMNIAPAELETLIASHPDVAEVAVIGYPDDVLGERVCAVVAPAPGCSVNFDDVLDHLERQGIATFKFPERLEVVTALPRNPVGKVLKRQLRREFSA